jgi:hypothetical protein
VAGIVLAALIVDLTLESPVETNLHPMEWLLGRSLAFCAHPYAAWRRLRIGGRALLVGAYFGAAYTVVLALLFAL